MGSTPFAWTHQSGLIDLGALEDRGYYFSNSIGVNRLGTVIVGWSGGSNFFSEPTLPVAWIPDKEHKQGARVPSWKIQALDISGYGQFSYWLGQTANNFGQITGIAWDNSGNETAFVWNPLAGGTGWKILQLPVPPEYADYTSTWARGINEKGEVAGAIWSATDGLPVLWQPVDRQRLAYKMTVLGTPPGMPSYSTYPTSINDLGDIVGNSYDAEWNPVPVYWSTKNPGSAQFLDFEGYFGVAYKVNNLRMVAGGYWSDTCPQGCAAAMQFRIK